MNLSTCGNTLYIPSPKPETANSNTFYTTPPALETAAAHIHQESVSKGARPIDQSDRLINHLDKSYTVDALNQLYADLDSLIYYTCKTFMTGEQYISEIHCRLDNISTLQLYDKLKGHLMLRQASLTPQDQNMVVGAVSGSYNIQHLTTAIRNAYMKQIPIESSLTTQRAAAPSCNE